MSDDAMVPMDDEYEQVDANEVDRVISAALDELIQSVQSETIRTYLETTAEEISFLVNEEEEEEYEEDIVDDIDDFDDLEDFGDLESDDDFSENEAA